MYNLLHERWIPVKRKTGEKPEYISPSQITDGLATNPIIALAAPRPDFNGALIQFLIGLVQTACPPKDEPEWQKKFRSPPSPEELKAAFEQYVTAFNLDGDGPRFMQDLFIKEGVSHQIDQLMIDIPNDEMIKKNTDHFQKRNIIHHICRRCCSIALFTLQINAPQGGRGHFTSVRGGGPLTTIVLGNNLWETVWSNVLSKNELSRYGDVTKNSDADRFPWLKQKRSQESALKVTSLDTNPVQVFWAMPRRISILFEKNPTNEKCDICGSICDIHARRYSDKSHGIAYSGEWLHPLSPYILDQKTHNHIPRHKIHGGVTYQHWLGLVLNTTIQNNLNEPAAIIHTFRENRSNPEDPFMRLWAFGYDMGKKKARGWYDGTMPLIHVDNDIRPEYEVRVSQLIETANQISMNTRSAIIRALFKPGTDIKGDLSVIDSEFWQNTEPDFYRVLGELHEKLKSKQPLNDLKLRWLSILAREGEVLFDRYSQSNLISVADPKRIALARRDFKKFSSPYNKKIIELLDLQKPEKSAKISDKERKIPEHVIS
ncbi:MAG: type I-E CRISPR-associated protein Cse1/CasA [Methanoregula sp.]